MGGGAFAQAYAANEATLRTPRMSPEEYKRVKNTSLKKVRDYLPNATVATLIEAPEKIDYGDVDLIIATDEPIDLVELANHLGASGVICHSSKKASLAILKPPEIGRSSPAVVYEHWRGKGKRPSDTFTDDEYAQLDVEVVSPAKFDWYAFYSSYGDMAGLIGHIVTQLGFTVSDSGFWLRLPELDATKSIANVTVADRDGMIFLSSNPLTVIRFLGCLQDQYETGFETTEALYEWIGSCRLLSPETIKAKRDNSHERNREQKRSLYSRFFNEWLPARMDVTVPQNSADTSERILHLRLKYLREAVDFFEVRGEYETKQAALRRALTNGSAATLIKQMIAEHSGKGGKQLNEVLRAFRRHVTFDAAGQPYVVAEPHGDAESELHRFLGPDGMSLQDAKATKEWVRVHWQELRRLERQRGKAVMPAVV